MAEIQLLGPPAVRNAIPINPHPFSPEITVNSSPEITNDKPINPRPLFEEAHYVYRVRDRLRTEIHVPLHRALELPEVYMSENQWNVVPYNRVASVAMVNYKKLFVKHDKDRFGEYLMKVKTGEAKIAAGALLPREIIKSLQDSRGEEADVGKLQWKRMVEDLGKKGKCNCSVMYDVSANMEGTPMEACVALGILVSELSGVPWKGRLFTFSSDPQIQKVEGEGLLEKHQCMCMKRMEWGDTTNFQTVFDRILEVAVKWNVSDEQMMRRVFVFGSMKFEKASENCWDTDYEAIHKKFREKGYTKVPEIVFWNLKDSRSIPVVANQSGVALVSGFSKNLLTMFLENGGIVNPEEVMEHAISGEEYNKLAVFVVWYSVLKEMLGFGKNPVHLEAASKASKVC